MERQDTKKLALLSVSDKRGLIDFARRLAQCGFELISTGGTARALREAGLAVGDVSALTGFPEMLDGRVKTLHPRVHGGLLGRWELPEHRRQMQAEGIAPIALLAVNLYPFEHVAQRASNEGVAGGELIENIDIGGPAMLRSAAKNYHSVAVVTDPDDYETVAAELEAHGAVGLETRWRLAQKAFQRTASYDAAIASTLGQLRAADLEATVHLSGQGSSATTLPAQLLLSAARVATLRYGENPHQRAAVYADPLHPGGLARAKLLHGKELSYNNLVDLAAAWELAAEFTPPAVAIIKHTNPAGCATAAAPRSAYELALACDPVSAYGGVVGLNRPLDGETAEAMSALFLECIAAPAFTPEALEKLQRKKNLRLVQIAPVAMPLTVRSIPGGWLAQTSDSEQLPAEGGWRVVTKQAPSAEQERALRFAWAVAKHVKSNAIVFARAVEGGGQTLAVGAGQMSRVDSVKIAVMKAQLMLRGAAVASDAFFPFPDGIEAAVASGATSFVQPGGSIHDDDCIAACDRLGAAMVFTGMRHFRH
ncbi:MAG: bifunctional phosphoribosylaminoimidazolecarboxamide formyltransferase/IMP cyclohydrolase [Terriglobales bacterium]